MDTGKDKKGLPLDLEIKTVKKKQNFPNST